MPKLNKPKLICVIALIYLFFSLSLQAAPAIKTRKHKYPVIEFQERALERSAELKLLDKSIKVAESKKWTSLAPGVGVGNNFVGDGDMRFNVTWDIAEVLGGGRIRQINLDIAQLKFKKLALESQLKLQVLENILALERAERNVERITQKLSLLHKRNRLVSDEYEHGEHNFDLMVRYWELEEDLEKRKLEMLDQVELEKARLVELVGDF